MVFSNGSRLSKPESQSLCQNVLEKVMFSFKIKDVKVKGIKNEYFLPRSLLMSIIFFPEARGAGCIYLFASLTWGLVRVWPIILPVTATVSRL